MTKDKHADNSPPPFDLEKAENMINKRALIGLTYYDRNGKFLEQKQMHGKIISVNRHGLKIALEGAHDGEIYTLPPDLQSFHEAPPGEYRERSSGEIIVNPDFTSMWEVNEGNPDFKANTIAGLG